MAQLLGHRQLARGYQPISKQLQGALVVAVAAAAAAVAAAAITTPIQGLEIVAVLEQAAIPAATRPSSNSNS
jgi:hypothetical protein